MSNKFKDLKFIGNEENLIAYPPKVHLYLSSRAPIPQNMRQVISDQLVAFYISRSTVRLKGLRGFENPCNRMDETQSYYSDDYSVACSERNAFMVPLKVCVLECEFYQIKSIETRLNMINDLVLTWMIGR